METTRNFLLKPLLTFLIVFIAGMLITQGAHATDVDVDVKAVGVVTFVTGDVYITHADKTTALASKNESLKAGDTIETNNGRVQLSLMDGGKVSLQPNTIYKINKYEFSGKEDGSEYAFTELLKGGLRTISGLIGHKNRDRYQLKTAVATIGIRGTEFTVNFNDNQLLMTTNHGSVDVCNTAGCLNAITGQSIVVSGLGATPKPSTKAAKAAAAAPTSSKAVFVASEQVNSADIATNTITPINTTPTNTTPSTPLIANSSSSGFLSTVMKTVCNCGIDGVFDALIETGNTALPTKLTVTGGVEIQPISFSSVNNDGLVGWGRVATGSIINAGTAQNIEWMDYAIGAKPNPTQLTNLTGTYNVFGSTAPMLLSTGGISTIIGAENAVTGNFTFNFANTSFSYGLIVNTTAELFTLSGGGNVSASNPTFSSNNFQSNITSQGLTCTVGTCSGALQGNRLIQGAFFGNSGERIGLQYGFDVPVGAVYGTAVLK